MSTRRIRFVGFAHTRTYSSATQAEWEPGEVREVDEVEAARLLTDFGPAFALVEPKPTRAVVESAPVKKAAPKRKRTPTKRKSASK